MLALEFGLDIPGRNRLTNFEAINFRFVVYFWGGANRKDPSGGSAYGMPKYSMTCLRFDARCPTIGPLAVCTVVCFHDST